MPELTKVQKLQEVATKAKKAYEAIKKAKEEFSEQQNEE